MKLRVTRSLYIHFWTDPPLTQKTDFMEHNCQNSILDCSSTQGFVLFPKATDELLVPRDRARLDPRLQSWASWGIHQKTLLSNLCISERYLKYMQKGGNKQNGKRREDLEGQGGICWVLGKQGCISMEQNRSKVMPSTEGVFVYSVWTLQEQVQVEWI